MLSPPPALAAPSLQSRAHGALLGGLVGDALALGGQYEYDARVIAEKVGSYTDFVSPSVNYGVGWGKVRCASVRGVSRARVSPSLRQTTTRARWLAT